MSDTDDTQDKPNEGAEGDDTGTGSGDAQGATGKPEEGKKHDAPAPIDAEEHERVVARMKAADKRASEVEEELKALKRKDQTELEKAQGDLQDAQKTIGDLQKRVNDMALSNAFLTDNKYSWHDASDAMRLLDMEGVEVKDDGTVEGLKSAIEKLAKTKPHLIKSDDDKGGSGGSSGSSGNGKRKGSGDEPPPNYSSRFPALRSRAAAKKS